MHWASRGALDIDGMGEEIVGRLVESGRLSDVADYYTLDEDELALLDMGRLNKEGESIRLGHTVARKLALKKKVSDQKAVKYENCFIGLLGIYVIGSFFYYMPPILIQLNNFVYYGE